jgi:hypothetical protein
MVRPARRCPVCASVVVLDQEIDRLAFACLGCARHWELPSEVERAWERESARLRANPTDGHRPRGRPRKHPATSGI